MIKASLRLDYEHTLALSEYTHGSEKFKSSRHSLGLIAIISLGIAVFLLQSYLRNRDSWAELSLAVIFGYVGIDMGRAYFKFIAKPKPLPEVMEQELTFDEGAFRSASKRDGMAFERCQRYESLHGAVEWGDWFFIYFTENEASILKKDELTEGSAEELRAFLKEKLGTRFQSGN